MKILLVMILTILGTCLGLKCYTCDDCGKEYAKPTTCLSNQNRCLKFTASDYVYKQCAIEQICSIKAFQRTVNNLWSNILEAVNPVSRQDLEELGDVNDWVMCCDSDYCNDAGLIRPSVVFIAAAMIAALAVRSI